MVQTPSSHRFGSTGGTFVISSPTDTESSAVPWGRAARVGVIGAAQGPRKKGGREEAGKMLVVDGQRQ